jgi:uncharacterized protein
MLEVKIIETVPLKKGDYKAVLGFAGAGFIGSTAVMFISRSKGFKQIACIRSPHIPPMTLIIDGIPTPSFRIYLDDVNGLIFLVTESLVPAESCWPIAKELLKWLNEKGVKEIYSLDGLPFSASSPEIKVLGYSNKIDLSGFGIPLLREGAVTGLDSCLMEECVEKGITYVSLFIPTNKLTSIDYIGSANAIDVLNKLFKLGVDSSPLKIGDESNKKAAVKKPSGFSRIFGKN